MSAIWSGIATLLIARIYRNTYAGAIIGFLVFSHWVMDFISHPMLGRLPDLPLFFDGLRPVCAVLRQMWKSC
jgi:hypothetical protein